MLFNLQLIAVENKWNSLSKRVKIEKIFTKVSIWNFKQYLVKEKNIQNCKNNIENIWRFSKTYGVTTCCKLKMEVHHMNGSYILRFDNEVEIGMSSI